MLPFRRLALVCFLPGLLFAATASLIPCLAWAHADEAPRHRVIVFVWDGMRPDAISAQDTPNLLALAQRGSRFDDNHATYPTFTMANASSFATGAFPGPIGFYGNHIWTPKASGLNAEGQAVAFQNPVFTEDYAILRDINASENHALLQVPTLLAAAQKAGLRTAVVGKSGPAFLQDYREGGLILDENTALPLAFAKELQAAGYPLPANAGQTYPADELTLAKDNGAPTAQGKVILMKDGVTADPTAAIETPPTAANAWMMQVYLQRILPEHRPDLSVVWLRNPDTTEHSYGVGSPEFHLALQAQDQLLGQLEEKLKVLGMDQDTDLIVVSDHGHSNVAGPVDRYPLRQITDGRVGRIDPEWGYSVSGSVRLADQLSHAGFTAYDGTGCQFVPVMNGIDAQGRQRLPTRYDDDGSLCGKPGPYTTPGYRVPDELPVGALVLAPNGGSEYVYQAEHDPTLIKRVVRFLQSRDYVAAIFVARRYGDIPGTLPAEQVHLENAARGPDIIISYAWDATARVQGFPGTVYQSFSNQRGQHGSFSPIDVHNTLIASGPSFRQGFVDHLPSGNVDLAPTLATLLNLPLPAAQGRPLFEALTGAAGRSVEDYNVRPATLQPDQPATGLQTRRIDGSALPTTQFSFKVMLKKLQLDGHSWTYFDQAAPLRQ